VTADKYTNAIYQVLLVSQRGRGLENGIPVSQKGGVIRVGF